MFLFQQREEIESKGLSSGSTIKIPKQIKKEIVGAYQHGND
jgi:hypothetical protein